MSFHSASNLQEEYLPCLLIVFALHLVHGVVVPCDKGDCYPCHHHTESFEVVGSTV